MAGRPLGKSWAIFACASASEPARLRVVRASSNRPCRAWTVPRLLSAKEFLGSIVRARFSSDSAVSRSKRRSFE